MVVTYASSMYQVKPMTSKPYDPILIATCVANLAHELGEPIYHTKLQRVLIYLNTEYIENYGVKLIDDTLVVKIGRAHV